MAAVTKDRQGEERPKPPSIFWTLMEGRAAFEFGSFLSLRLAMRSLPKGDGHPVLVLPGFVASDFSTRPLRGVLKDLGYKTYGWGLGRNLKFNDAREAEMLALVNRIYDQHGQKLSIIGWSLGGVFARELAKRAPEKVRFVISLGSPITRHRDYSNARRLYDVINGPPAAARAEQLSRLGEAPPVPTTSIFSRSDGVVAWRGSLQAQGDENPQIENIEAPASHFGLGVNPLVVYLIADRLAQSEGDWKPFDHAGLRKLFFRKH
ncbi:MAG TPA: alpha/beta hydrolase [Parvularcula sp.]|nr:alpha/beta hydrolase [Parvularcula sp.]HBS33339.1 alpha/beta hydrolase [Parvularcula sp.]HBS33475.1 alpha/beta hydrolase [Parvularcula sp.]